MAKPRIRSLWLVLPFVLVLDSGIVGASGPLPSSDDMDADGVEDAFEDALVSRFAPRVHLFPDAGFPTGDRFRPASVAWLLAGAWMAFNQAPCFDDPVLPPGAVDDTTMLSRYDMAKAPLFFCAKFPPWVFSGPGPAATRFYLSFETTAYTGNLAGAPCYAHVVPSEVPGAAWDVQFWFFYPYNGDVFLVFGHHEGDWEHVTVRVEPDASTVHSVYMAAHDGGQAFFPGDGALQFTEDGRPRVYSAWNSHASFPTAGVHPRTFPLPPDYTADGGPVLDCLGRSVNVGERDLPLNGSLWLRYSGHWGRPGEWWNIGTGGGPAGPAYQDAWNPSSRR